MKSRSAMLAFVALALSIGLAAKDKKAPDAYSDLQFTVLKDDNGKPVRNASVVLHPVGKDGKQSNAGYQLKTDSEGKTHAESVPYGKLRIQVLTPGFQTFGHDYDIDQPTTDIQIRLKRPAEQLTIYDKPAATNKDDGSPQQGTPVELPPKQ